MSESTAKPKLRFKCRVCSKHFRSVGILRRHHDEMHMGIKKYICDICKMRFHTKNGIYMHMTVHSTKLYHCQHCFNIYKSEASLWRHMLKHFDEETLKRMRPKKATSKPKCVQCNKEFVRRHSLKRHNIHIHATTKNFSCDVCAKTFASKYRLQLHMVVHSSKKLYRCEHCNKSYKRQGCLNLHLLSHRVDYNPYVVCEICRIEISKRYLRTHMLIHTNQSFSCDICNKTFKYKASLYQHNQRHCKREKSFACEICDNRFTTKGNLRIHERVHTKEKPYRCNVCNKRFRYNSSLNAHKRSHNGIRTHVCNTCGMRFAAHNTLINHERIHTNAKPYTCGICGNVYRRKQSIVEHMVQHTGILNYGCSLCNLQFVTLNEVIMHNNRHKRGTRFICEVCGNYGKDFVSKKSLVAHLATHRDLKRPCRECGQVFVGKLRLYRHIKESHKNLLLI